VIFMNVLITGVPCVGKTTLAKEFAKLLKLKVYGDKKFVTKDNSKKVKTLEGNINDVVISKYVKEVNSKIIKKDNILLEGLLFPYCIDKLRLDFDYIFILSLEEKKLVKRMKERKYFDEKIQDNIFVQDSSLIYNEIIENLPRKQKATIIYEVELSGNFKRDLKSLLALIPAKIK